MEISTSIGRLVIVGAMLAALMLPAHADARKTRHFRWSGYTWTARHTYGPSNPGHNIFSDSRRSVRVNARQQLELSILNGRATEVVGPRLGYGTYSWRVRSDLTKFDRWRVVGLFVWVPNGNEQDIEFAHWGVKRGPVGWAVSWSRGRRVGFTNFPVTPARPYTVRMTWTPAFARYTMTDRYGRTLVDVSYPQLGAVTFHGRAFQPRISNWLWPGVPGVRLSRRTRHGWHPNLRLDSFRFSPDR